MDSESDQEIHFRFSFIVGFKMVVCDGLLGVMTGQEDNIVP
jgi:hypothetical protein